MTCLRSRDFKLFNAHRTTAMSSVKHLREEREKCGSCTVDARFVHTFLGDFDMTKNGGFSLIEVLVTLVILMFGMLGIAGMMAKGQQMSFESFQRHQALQIAGDMAERLRSNRAQAAAYRAAAPLPGLGAGSEYTDLVAAGSCQATACNPAQVVGYDIGMWVGLLQGRSEMQGGVVPVGGIINARGCIELAPVTVPPLPPNMHRVSVSWQGKLDHPGTVYPSACGEGLYGAAGQRRMVSVDVSVD